MAASYNPGIIDPKNVRYIFDAGSVRSYPGTGNLLYNLNPSSQFKTDMDVPGSKFISKGVGSYFNLNNDALEGRSANNTFFFGKETTVSLWIYPENVNDLQVIYQLNSIDNFTGTAIYISGGYIGAENHNITPDGEEIGYTIWYSKITPNMWYNITLVGPQLVSSSRLGLYVNGVSAFSAGGGAGTEAGGQKRTFLIGCNEIGSRVYNFLTQEQVILNSQQYFKGRFSKFSYITTNKLTPRDVLDIYNKDKARYEYV